MSKKKQDSIHYVDAHVGKRLRQRRLMLKISQDQLANYVNLTFQQIHKYEKGLNRISCSKLFEFAKFLQTDVAYFFRGLNEDQSSMAADSASADYSSTEQMEPATLLKAFTNIRSNQLKQNILNIVCSLSDQQ